MLEPLTRDCSLDSTCSHIEMRQNFLVFSMVILSFLLIQELQLSVSEERMCTNTVELLRGLNLPKKTVVR